LLAAADKARDVLGWSPQFGLQQIVETAWRWEERLQSFVK
jgi:UDP-glucose 4-epimerase